jgi:hypothetical protein
MGYTYQLSFRCANLRRYLLLFCKLLLISWKAAPKSCITNSRKNKKMQDLRVKSLNTTYLQEKILMYACALAFW